MIYNSNVILGAVSFATLASAAVLIVFELKRSKRDLDGKPKKKKVEVVHDHGETFVQAVVDGKEV